MNSHLSLAHEGVGHSLHQRSPAVKKGWFSVFLMITTVNSNYNEKNENNGVAIIRSV